MENQEVKQLAEDVVKAEIRKGNLIRNKDVLSMLPELIDSVHIDRKKLRGSIEQCLSSNNPFNAILNLFGVQIIQKEKTINSLLNSSAEHNDVAVQIDDSYVRQWLTVNPVEFTAIVEKISRKLFDLETQANKMYDDEKSRGDELFSKYEKLTREHNELKYSAETNEKLIAERIQYILSLGGEAANSDNEQLVELLKDMSIDVCWNCIEAPLTDTAMFTEYVIEDESLAGIKPCLIRNGSVYVKGMRFIKKHKVNSLEDKK